MALSGIEIQIFKIHLNFRAGASIAWYCIIGLTHNGLCSTCEYYLILLDILGENISCIEKSDSVNSEGCHNNERLCRSWERKPPTSVPEGIVWPVVRKLLTQTLDSLSLLFLAYSSCYHSIVWLYPNLISSVSLKLSHVFIKYFIWMLFHYNCVLLHHLA